MKNFFANFFKQKSADEEVVSKLEKFLAATGINCGKLTINWR